MLRKPGPFSIHVSALHVAAHHEHAIRMTVIRPAIPVLFRRAPEFTHRHKHNIFHPVAHVTMKRRQPLPQIFQQIRQLPLHAAFIHVIVPAAAIHKQNLHANVRLNQLSHLLQTLPQSALRIIRAILRLILRRIGFPQHINRFKRFRPRSAQRLVHRLRVHRLKSAFGNFPRAGRLRHHFELLHVRQRNRRRASA